MNIDNVKINTSLIMMKECYVLVGNHVNQYHKASEENQLNKKMITPDNAKGIGREPTLGKIDDP